MFKNRLFSTIIALVMLGVGVVTLTPNPFTRGVQTAAPTVVAQDVHIIHPTAPKKRIAKKHSSRAHIRKPAAPTRKPFSYKAPNVHSGSGELKPYGINQRIGYSLAKKRGWGGQQWNCLKKLWYKESGWSAHSGSYNHSYGIPQALPGYKMASAGSDWRTNPYTQIRWGLGYISGRYGSPCRAWAHSQSYNWY